MRMDTGDPHYFPFNGAMAHLQDTCTHHPPIPVGVLLPCGFQLEPPQPTRVLPVQQVGGAQQLETEHQCDPEMGASSSGERMDW